MINTLYNKKAFTLIELIIIIVILGIIAAIAIPKYLDSKKAAEKSVAEGLIGAMRSALTIYYSNWFAKNKGTPKNFRDNISIPNFVKLQNDSMGLTGNEALIIDKSITSNFTEEKPSIRDYALDGGSGRRLRFEFKGGGVLDIYYDREKPSIEATYSGFN